MASQMDSQIDINVPLVLDVDGSLIRNDLTHELLWLGLCFHPIKTLLIVLRYFAQKNRLKGALFDLVGGKINTAALPYNQAVIAQAKTAHNAGRNVILCSGSEQRLIHKIAAQFDFITESYGSNPEVNLTASRKAEFLKRRYPVGFDYVGNSSADIPVWEESRRAFGVNPPSSAKSITSKNGARVETIDQSGGRVKAAFKAMRLHQWSKNFLLFLIPILVIDEIGLDDFAALFIAFLAMGLLASATYILNDLVDIQCDRAHGVKQNRPFANGSLGLPAGLIMAAIGIVIAAVLAASINILFFGVLAGYLCLTLVYSFCFKRIAIVDVLTLATLFLIRVAAGGAVIFEPLSPWLICFVLSLFLSLSLVKRYAEISKAALSHNNAVHNNKDRRIEGRGYLKTDGPLVLAFGIMALAMTLISFMLYSLIAAEPALHTWQALFTVGIILTFWMMRIWLLSYRGEMNEDPVLFALKDPLSLILGLLVVIAVLVEKLQVLL